MNIALIDVDGHNFPNLPLMKLSQWHKQNGDCVEMIIPLKRYDIAYKSKVFDATYSRDIDYVPMADVIVEGGTGYSLDNKLPKAVEHCFPDYSLYGITDTAYGFLTRGCPRDCGFCICTKKEGACSRKVADLGEFWDGQKKIVLMDPNILASPDHPDLFEQLARSRAKVDINQGLDIRLMDDPEIEAINSLKSPAVHFAWDNPYDDLEQRFAAYSEKAKWKSHGRYGTVYVLTNYNSTIAQDLYRVTVLDALGYDPYVMVYDKQNADKMHRNFQRWVNNKIIFRSCTWEEYKR